MYGDYENRGSRDGHRTGGRSTGRSGFQTMTPPVKIGDEFDVRIEAVGEKGDGIAKKQSFVIFVPGVKEGEAVRVRVTKVLRKVGFGEKIGEALGPLEEPSAKPQSRPAQNMSVEEVMEPEPAPEDSETFGDESNKESKVESQDFGDEPEDLDEAPENDDSEER